MSQHRCVIVACLCVILVIPPAGAAAGRSVRPLDTFHPVKPAVSIHTADSAGQELLVSTTADIVNGDTTNPTSLAANPGSDGISLREALQAAGSGNGQRLAIGFHPALEGASIILTNELPLIVRDGVSLNGDVNADGEPDITIDGNGLTSPPFRVFNASDISVEGFRLVNCAGIGISVENYHGGAGSSVRQVAVRNNYFSGFSRSAVEVLLSGVSSASISDVEISGNIIENSTGGIGVFASGADGDANNLVKDIAIISNTLRFSGYHIAIYAQAAGTYAVDNDNNTIDGLVIRGNTVTGATTTSLLLVAANGPGCTGNTISNMTIADNYIDGTPVAMELVVAGGGDASVMLNALKQVTITNNTLVNGGIQVVGANALNPNQNYVTGLVIERNRITHATANGILVTAGDGGAHDNRIERVSIRNNLIIGSVDAGILLAGADWYSPRNSIDGVAIANNTLVQNGLASSWSAGGINIHSKTTLNTITSVAISSTILWGNRLGDAIGGSIAPAGVSHSILNDSRFTGSSGNIYENPLFTDPANGDYGLAGASPAVDAGDPAALESGVLDLTGKTRVWDGNADGIAQVDAGALEYAAPVSPRITVHGYGLVIFDGDTVPGLADGTDFGTIRPGAAPVAHTFNISNGGALPLALKGSPPVVITGENAADFTVMVQPETTISASGGTTVTILFTPSEPGIRRALVHIDHDAPAGSPFTFAVKGEALEPNRAPEDIYLSAHEADENLPAGTVISTMDVNDPDTGDTHTYSLVDTEHYPDNAALAVDGALLRAAVVFNYEVKDYYAFKLRCTDAGGLSIDKPFLLTIRDQNDAPVTQDQTITTTINMPLTFTLVALDEDGDALSWKRVVSPAHGTLTGAGTRWTYTPHQDYSGADSVRFEVDDGALSAQSVVAVTILDNDFRRVYIPLAAR